MKEGKRNKQRRIFNYGPKCRTLITFYAQTKYAQPSQMGAGGTSYQHHVLSGRVENRVSLHEGN